MIFLLFGWKPINSTAVEIWDTGVYKLPHPKFYYNLCILPPWFLTCTYVVTACHTFQKGSSGQWDFRYCAPLNHPASSRLERRVPYRKTDQIFFMGKDQENFEESRLGKEPHCTVSDPPRWNLTVLLTGLNATAQSICEFLSSAPKIVTASNLRKVLFVIQIDSMTYRHILLPQISLLLTIEDCLNQVLLKTQTMPKKAAVLISQSVASTLSD